VSHPGKFLKFYVAVAKLIGYRIKLYQTSSWRRWRNIF